MATTSMDRIVSLDIIRGLAVMGIFSVNVVGMAMIQNAYFYPPDYGFSSLGDKIMWALNFIIVDGKFRSLFSILFGASMTLVIERAIATARSGWRVHYARMVVLLLFGLAHYYLLWWGDILANYALVGMIAFIFYRLKPKWLLLLAALSLSAQYGPMLYFGGQQIAKYEAKRSPDASPILAFTKRVLQPCARPRNAEIWSRLHRTGRFPFHARHRQGCGRGGPRPSRPRAAPGACRICTRGWRSSLDARSG